MCVRVCVIFFLIVIPTSLLFSCKPYPSSLLRAYPPTQHTLLSPCISPRFLFLIHGETLILALQRFYTSTSQLYPVLEENTTETEAITR